MFGKFTVVISGKYVTTLSSIVDKYSHTSRRHRGGGGGGGDVVVSLICDNYGTNRGVYKLMGGPGKVTKELSFTKDGKEHIACWSDVVGLYEEDRKSDLRLTKLTHTSVYPKPLH